MCESLYANIDYVKRSINCQKVVPVSLEPFLNFFAKWTYDYSVNFGIPWHCSSFSYSFIGQVWLFSFILLFSSSEKSIFFFNWRLSHSALKKNHPLLKRSVSLKSDFENVKKKTYFRWKLLDCNLELKKVIQRIFSSKDCFFFYSLNFLISQSKRYLFLYSWLFWVILFPN